MNEVIKGILSVAFATAFMVFLITVGFDAMTYSMHRLNFETSKLSNGIPYSYEELQECDAGIYKNIKKYSEFFTRNTLFGNEILDKNKYYIISKRKTSYWAGNPSWEKENPSYYYCMGKL